MNSLRLMHSDCALKITAKSKEFLFSCVKCSIFAYFDLLNFTSLWNMICKMPVCSHEAPFIEPSNCYLIDEINLIGRYFKVQKFIMEFPLHWSKTSGVHESAVRYTFEQDGKKQTNKCLSKYLHLKYNHCLHSMISGPMKLELVLFFVAHHKWWLNGTWVWLLV